jgi:hypothetical protein
VKTFFAKELKALNASIDTMPQDVKAALAEKQEAYEAICVCEREGVCGCVCLMCVYVCVCVCANSQKVLDSDFLYQRYPKSDF